MNHINHGKRTGKLAMLALAPLMALAGCSNDGALVFPGSGGGTGTASGFAYDGYLVGALVCVDENLNKSCDTAEPQTLTGPGGTFTIPNLTPAQQVYPLVLQSTTNTYDEDNPPPGGPYLGPGLKYMAPGGSTSVNALTTVVQSKIEQAIAAGSTSSLAALKTAAVAEVATELGLPGVDVTAFDPIAAKADTGLSSSERRDAAKLHLINQVLSEQILAVLPTAEANAVTAGSTSTAAFGALLDNFDVADVAAAVDADTAGLTLNQILVADETAVTSETPPAAPSGPEILAQEADDAIVATEIDQEASTATGATGGTGT